MSDGQFQIWNEKLNLNTSNTDIAEFNRGLNSKTMTGTEKIAQERLEQKTTGKRHSPKSDWEQYPDFELAMFAEAVLTGNVKKIPHYADEAYWQKLCSKEYEQRLVIAGALIAAEIDRINFTE